MTNDREAVSDLITRLYRLLDEQRFDELSSVYAEDAELVLPRGRGEMHGLDAVTAKARERAEKYPRSSTSTRTSWSRSTVTWRGRAGTTSRSTSSRPERASTPAWCTISRPRGRPPAGASRA